MKITLIAIPLLLLGCENNQKEKTDLTEMNLIGEVKQFQEIDYDAIEKFGEVVKGEQDGFIKESYFNEQGAETATYWYEFDRNQGYRFEIINDQDGNKLEERDFGLDNKLSSIVKYTYDDNWNLIEENSYNDDGSLFRRHKYEIDNKGNVIKSNEYDQAGILITSNIYTYDENNNKVEWAEYDSNGKLEIKSNYKYDKQNNIIEINTDFPELENSFGRIGTTYYNYEYDKRGNWIKRIEFVGTGKKAKKITYRTITYY